MYPQEPLLLSTQYIANPNQLKSGLDPYVDYVIDPNYMVVDEPIVLNAVSGNEDFSIRGRTIASSWLGIETGDPLFKNRDGSPAGSIFLSDTNLFSTNNGVLALESTAGISIASFRNVQFINSVSMGYLDGYDQIEFERIALFGMLDGIEFRNATSGGITSFNFGVSPLKGRTPIDQSFGFIPFTGTVFKAGSGFTIADVFETNINAIGIDNTASICDFSPSNILRDGGFICNSVISNPDADSFPNLPATSVKALFLPNCENIDITHIGGKMEITTEALTTIPSSNTLVPIQGVGTYSEMTWWAAYGAGNDANEMEYISDVDRDFTIQMFFSVGGGNNDQCGLSIQKYSVDTGLYTAISPTAVGTLNGGGGTRGENITTVADEHFKKGDRIRVFIENQSDSSDMTALISSLLTTRVRN